MAAYRDTRAIYLFCAFIVLGVVWAFFFSGWFRSREIVILTRTSPTGRLVFSLGDDYQIEMVQVKDTVDGQVLWQARFEDGESRRTFTYGDPEASSASVEAVALESGHDYVLYVKTSGGNAEHMFTLP